MDDSPAKAARQPYNHLCVREYTRARRDADLAALQHAQEATTTTTSHAASPSSSSSPSPSPPPQDGNNETRKRKRKREKEHIPLTIANDTHDAQAACAASPTPVLDETLLAVIGILHATRLQDNIAGWMHAGALLSERGTVWCDDLTLVHTWAQRGREAMRELQLEVEHGVIPDP